VPLVSIVVSAYNEEGTIGPVLERLELLDLIAKSSWSTTIGHSLLRVTSGRSTQMDRLTVVGAACPIW
jgi:hypothetical protein